MESDGTVWAWGYNSDGQLGVGDNVDRTHPVQVTGLTDVVAIAAGLYHSLALKADGTVWAWGYNGYGGLGDGTNVHSYTPVQVLNVEDATAIASGAYQSFAIAPRLPCTLTCTASASPLSGSAPLTVSFTAAATPSNCTQNPSYAWDFTTDGTTDDTTQNPTHTYNSPGTYTWTMTASADGQTCVQTGTITVTADDTPPDTSMTSSQCGTTISSDSTTFTWTGSDNVTPTGSLVYAYRLDGASWSAFGPDTSHTYTGLANGTHTFEVKAKDLAGNEDPTPATCAVEVNHDPPVISAMMKAGSPFRIKVLGSNLQDGIQVFINGQLWGDTSNKHLVKWKNSGKIVVKKGAALKAVVPKHATTTFRFVNPDGGWATMDFTWP